jgi:TetR/AcrR family transcriptional regulator
MTPRKLQPAKPAVRQQADTRHAILRAAIAEFSELGMAGARTDSIARAAGVNKALLHYYYGSKDALYGAVLDEVLAGYLETHLAMLRGDGTPGERILRYFLAHFNHLAAHGAFSRLMEYEMMRARKGHASHISRLVKNCLGPLNKAVRETIIKGVQTGEFRRIDPGQFALSITGANVFYFVAVPVVAEINGWNPRSPEMLELRRAALLDLAAAALFANREEGLFLAKAVRAESKSSKTQRNPRGKRQ